MISLQYLLLRECPGRGAAGLFLLITAPASMCSPDMYELHFKRGLKQRDQCVQLLKQAMVNAHPVRRLNPDDQEALRVHEQQAAAAVCDVVPFETLDEWIVDLKSIYGCCYYSTM